MCSLKLYFWKLFEKEYKNWQDNDNNDNHKNNKKHKWQIINYKCLCLMYQWASGPVRRFPRRTGWQLGPRRPSPPVCPPPANQLRSPHPDGCAELWSPRGLKGNRLDPRLRHLPHLCPKSQRRLRRVFAAVGGSRNQTTNKDIRNYISSTAVKTHNRLQESGRLHWCQQLAVESAAAPCISRCELSGLQRLRRVWRGDY